MKTLLLVLLTATLTFSQFNESIFDNSIFNYTPIIYTINVLETPFPPGFLDDYSAPGQILWNSQVNWMLRDDRPTNTINYYTIPRKRVKQCTEDTFLQ